MKEVKADIISGFLGAGKTTFLNKILPCLKGRNVLIENEFGDIGLDGEVLQGKVPVKEIYAGCICCSLALDFKKSIMDITEKYDVDRIIVEPSGVGKLSDIVDACKKVNGEGVISLRIDRLITIVDLSEFEDYVETFGDFYLDQIVMANLIFFSHMEKVSKEKLHGIVEKIREINSKAVIYEENWFDYDGEKLLDIIDAAKISNTGIKESISDEDHHHIHFGSYSTRNPRVMNITELNDIMKGLEEPEYGKILRVKGILTLDDGNRIHLDYTPGNFVAAAEKTDMDSCLTVIGCNLNKEKLRKQFERRYTKWRKL